CLADLAGKFKQPPPPSPRIAATRRWRTRERNGRILLKLELDEVSLVLALVDAGLLGVNEADNREAVSVAARRAFELFIAGDISPHGDRDRIKIGLLLAALRKKAN